MNTQVNWQKIRNEFNRLTHVEALKTEVQRIGQEIRKFDFQSVLSPAAKQKVKTFEKRYATLMRTLHQAQRQVDREFNRIMRDIKTRRADVDKAVTEQKSKLEKVSQDLQKRFAKTASSSRGTKKAAGTKKRSGPVSTRKSSTTRKRKKA